MTAQTAEITRTYEFGDEIYFTNSYGQRGVARVISHDGDMLTIDYLGCQHEIAIDSITIDQ